jgi:hypothetical protein
MRLASLVFALVDFRFPQILAGHGYDVGGNTPAGESDGSDDEGGIGTMWILAASGLALVTAAILIGLDPSGAKAKLRGVAPKAVLLVIIAVPLIAWTATSSGDGDGPNLIVERAIGLDGAPELLVSLGDDDLNTLESTGGKKAVGLECVGREGRVVFAAEQPWPFVDEPGYDYPHAHQPASREQLQRADRCSLQGTRKRLEADVQGPLPR